MGLGPGEEVGWPGGIATSSQKQLPTQVLLLILLLLAGAAASTSEPQAEEANQIQGQLDNSIAGSLGGQPQNGGPDMSRFQWLERK